MSIRTEIDRLGGAKDDIAAAIAEKGVQVPSGTKLDSMAALIREIPVMDEGEAFLAAHPVGTYLYTTGLDPNDVAGTWSLRSGGLGPAAWLRTA